MEIITPTSENQLFEFIRNVFDISMFLLLTVPYSV